MVSTRSEPEKPASSNNSKKQKKKTYLMLLVFLAASITAMVVTFSIYYVSNKKVAFNVPDVDTAANSCEQEVKDAFGKELLHKSYDHGSSRYEENRRRYVIWYRLTIRRLDSEGIAVVQDKMAKCEVWEFLGYVSSFEVYDL